MKATLIFAVVAGMVFAAMSVGDSDLSPHPAPRPAAVVDVTDYGASPNDGQDDTLAVLKAVRAVREQGGTLRFPSGVLEVSRTIDLGDVIGLRVQGQGVMAGGFKLNAAGEALLSKPLAASVLAWTGPAGGTVVRYGGSGGVFDGLTIWGSGTAGVGFQLYKAEGVGSGHSRFTAIGISGCDIAFRAGENEEDGNCGDLAFGSFRVEDCDTGFRVENNQGVNYSFQHANFNRTATLFDFQRGGLFHCQFVHAVQADTVLRIGRIGSGNGLYRIGMLSLDRSQQQAPRLVDHEHWGPARVSIASAKLDPATPAREDALFRLYGDANVVVENTAYLKGRLYEVTAGSQPYRPVKLQFVNCLIGEDPVGIKSGPLDLTMTGCRTPAGGAVNDVADAMFD